MVEFKNFSRLLKDVPVLFKAELIFKDFLRKPSKFKYFALDIGTHHIIEKERIGILFFCVLRGPKFGPFPMEFR